MDKSIEFEGKKMGNCQNIDTGSVMALDTTFFSSKILRKNVVFKLSLLRAEGLKNKKPLSSANSTTSFDGRLFGPPDQPCFRPTCAERGLLEYVRKSAAL